jgi:HSP20 family protein
MFKKKSFFDKLTGSVRLSRDEYVDDVFEDDDTEEQEYPEVVEEDYSLMEESVGELPVDVYQTSNDVIVQTLVAGVKPDDIMIDISREMLTVEGHRKESRSVQEDNYYARELYWGAFSRTIMLPAEVNPDKAEATEKHGLLTIKIPKVDKGRQSKVKIKSI